MKLIVKSLKGGYVSTIDVTDNTSILEVKRLVEDDLKIPAAQQTLVFFGKTLQDDKTIGFYPKIKDGAKLFVAIKKPESLVNVLHKFLKNYYTDEQCKRIVDEFMKNFQTKVDSLSLDDLERIAKWELSH